MRDLVAGMAVALAAGLLGGAAMRPNLDEGGALPAPQIFTRAEAPPPDLGLAAYPGKTPDYVYGTDLKKQTSAYAAAPPAYEDAYVPADAPRPAEEAADDAVLTAGAGDAPSLARYPSTDGGEPYVRPQATNAEVG